MLKRLATPLMLLAAVACTEAPLFEDYIKLPDSTWPQDSVIEIEVMIEHTDVAYTAFSGIRHSPSYPYRNLYIFREVESERGLEYRDTIMYVLSDNRGKRLGDGFGASKEIIAPFGRTPFKFGERGVYTFRFIQGMRPNAVHGIDDLYFRINTVTETP